MGLIGAERGDLTGGLVSRTPRRHLLHLANGCLTRISLGDVWFALAGGRWHLLPR